MNEHDLKHIIEATLLAAGKPVTTQQLLDLFDERERPTDELFTTAIGMLIVDYETRGIELLEVASGWRIQVRQRTAEVVSRLWQERPTKYSRAFLETLALIAYRQPITRSEIEEIRGVSISSTIMRTLQERNWIRTVGHREVPGRPELLGTTRDFLDYFGLKSLDQLPTLAELKDLDTIGVQLELPADQAPAPEEGAEGEAGATAEGASEETVASGEAAQGEVAATEANATDADATAADADATEEGDAGSEEESGGDAEGQIVAQASDDSGDDSDEDSDDDSDDDSEDDDVDDADDSDDEDDTDDSDADDEDEDDDDDDFEDEDEDEDDFEDDDEDDSDEEEDDEDEELSAADANDDVKLSADRE
ncbi:SMC-Scp complex subunit ScpB [Steroidobacter sp.]|uniref:SMC-Scp complex subunit ScpB n=1 Tax=Steroidobacter sp. TaxID=1978227 RepID=UPI001A3757F1|nr:SMC-Scp complex subunit ScpB [Steroidobacter sp.]MBL8266782.1 SMC-Scp complex subunit ScpB [Steroidobacter sp.]